MPDKEIRTLFFFPGELRRAAHGVIADQYKDYVLILPFIKLVSDNCAGMPYTPINTPTGSSLHDIEAFKGSEFNGKMLRDVSLESTGCNRTLGLKALDSMQVTMPDFGLQFWFEEIFPQVRNTQATTG